ncbi:MAG: hypothetical protein ABIK28_13210, partial [Planctomycetota bacterium]
MKVSKSLLFILILVGTGILFFIFLYKPFIQDIKEIKKEIIEGQLRSNRETFIVQVLSEKTKHVETLRAEVDVLKDGLLSIDEQHLFMNDIRATINRFDLQVDSSLEKG